MTNHDMNTDLGEIAAGLSDVGQVLGDATGTLAGLRATAEENEQERERLTAEVEELRAKLRDADRLLEERAHTIVAWQTACGQHQQAVFTAQAERDDHAEKLAALALVKTWRNEDGRDFVFVSDLLDRFARPLTENTDGAR